jgi:hypothetical protein
MGFFSKKQNTKTKAEPRNPTNFMIFRLLAVGYLAYLCVDMVKLYLAGGPDAPSLPILIGILAVLGGGTIFVAIVSYKAWKKSKAEYDAYMADLRADAEAKRAAEEAEAAALAAEDEYYESLEATQTED